jgi:hypothetical protein
MDRPACTDDRTLAEDLNHKIDIREKVISKLHEELEAKRAVSHTIAYNTKATPITNSTTSPGPQPVTIGQIREGESGKD